MKKALNLGEFEVIGHQDMLAVDGGSCISPKVKETIVKVANVVVKIAKSLPGPTVPVVRPIK